MENGDYRKRFYAQYAQSHWQYSKKASTKSFNIVAKVYSCYLNRFLPADKSASILDIACGAGDFLYFLQSQGFNNTKGIDLGAEQISIATKMGVKNVEQGNLFEYLQKNLCKFDMIMASNILEHFKKEELVRVVDLIYGALKPEGKIAVITPNVASLSGISSTFGDFTHEMVFTSGNLSQLLRVCNFSHVEVVGIGPVSYDLKSGIRTLLWKIFKVCLRGLNIVERGTGRSIWNNQYIPEPILLAVGQK